MKDFTVQFKTFLDETYFIWTFKHFFVYFQTADFTVDTINIVLKYV